MDNFFNIKSKEDEYFAVGKIIEASQKFEQEFKKCVNLLEIDMPNLEFSTLNKLNDKIYERGTIDSNLHLKLKEVIKQRNYINHNFFLKNCNDYQKINDELNTILFYIFEANDVISNIIDKLSGKGIMRPTIFD